MFRSLHQFVAEKNVKYALRFDLNSPAIQSVEHSVVLAKEVKTIQFKLFSLPCYMAEEAPRILTEGIQLENQS